MIRPAAVGDAAQIAGVHTRSRMRAYVDFIPGERLLEDSLGERTEQWRGRLAPSSPVATWVWDQEGRIAGFVSAGTSQEPDLDPGRCDCLWALYVDPAAQGAGLGGRLLAHAEDQMRRRGRAEAILWVFTANEPARRFYESRGWVEEPGSEYHPEDWDAPSVRYRRKL